MAVKSKSNAADAPAAYYELFDPYLRDHGIAALKEWTDTVSRDPSMLPWAVKTIEDCLLAPLNSYLVERHAAGMARFKKEREHWKKKGIENHPPKRSITTAEEAAVKFSTAANDLREAWEQNRLLASRVKNLFLELERCWTEFIVCGSAHLMYHDLPVTRKRHSDAAKKPRFVSRKIDRDELEKNAATMLATGTEQHNLVGKLAEKFKVSPKAIRDALPPKFKKKSS